MDTPEQWITSWCGCQSMLSHTGLMAASLVVTNTRSASLRHVGRVVYDLQPRDDVALAIAMFRATRRDCDDASVGEGRCGEGRAYPARADDADIAMVFGQFPMWGLSLRAGAKGGIFCDN